LEVALLTLLLSEAELFGRPICYEIV
jgi:hypothetical protein